MIGLPKYVNDPFFAVTCFLFFRYAFEFYFFCYCEGICLFCFSFCSLGFLPIDPQGYASLVCESFLDYIFWILFSVPSISIFHRFYLSLFSPIFFFFVKNLLCFIFWVGVSSKYLQAMIFFPPSPFILFLHFPFKKLFIYPGFLCSVFLLFSSLAIFQSWNLNIFLYQSR